MTKTVVKLCGNHSLQDLQYSVNSGANYIGLVFAESKRKVDAFQCSKWMEQIHKKEKQKYVGVFVNPTISEIHTVLAHVPLDIIQLHGLETSETARQIKTETNLTVWKAIHDYENGLDKMKEFRRVVDGYVIDSKVQGAWGGTGKCFNWARIPDYKWEAERQGVPCLIAGGITPDNVRDLLEYSPHGIDLSSGIESNGRKDENKIQLLKERLNEHDNNRISR